MDNPLRNSRAIGASIFAIAALGFSACGSDVTSQDATTSVDQATAAVALAEQDVGGTAFELDEEGSEGWDVDVVADGQVTEVRVNAKGTEVTSSRSDGRIDVSDQTRLNKASVAMTDAIKTASGEVVGRVTSAELDRFRVTTLVWEIEFNDGEDDVTVSVDAATGGVVNVDRD